MELMAKHTTALLEGLVGMIRGLENPRSGGVSVAEGTLAHPTLSQQHCLQSLGHFNGCSLYVS